MMIATVTDQAAVPSYRDADRSAHLHPHSYRGVTTASLRGLPAIP